MPPLLTMTDLACTRGGRRLLDGFDLTLGAGGCTEVRGANGSGKSTLLRIAAGLFADYSGAVEAAPRHYLGHRNGVSALLSPLENLKLYERPGGHSVREALTRVGLQDALNAPSGQLSQGQQRRVGLARLLLGDKPLWLLDEPLTALDADGRRLVRELVEAHCHRGGAVLCATHQPLGCSASEVHLRV
ncbi:MAG: heme ABC exporter ATP-binding protein CcmA [Gammaproteobacteria bacterium]|nr:heme ABC exporter ATP-binding protein CcmA [Gammaproteobacteria bacterium]MXX29778.1 heme ABC exporter ATP-binding protein CcmA [Gammaproteobacteria bacterium]MYE53305.1 heme ABC exporter ATP-binding protein CcmA [Gammaproteobacteria bacterium]MYE85550.1 heme ABC exporter ATP-binding protein CcmA [Gammaproteobacteria bacterium]MYF50840.1 heme ABC exporter ATP-binding protein CcmA [Gammaproteobacteria bacterium]